MQIFRPVQLMVLAAEGKNLDRGSSSTGRAVKILFGHPPVLKLYMCTFSDLCYLLVWAAEGKTGLLFGAFIIGFNQIYNLTQILNNGTLMVLCFCFAWGINFT